MLHISGGKLMFRDAVLNGKSDGHVVMYKDDFRWYIDNGIMIETNRGSIVIDYRQDDRYIRIALDIKRLYDSNSEGDISHLANGETLELLELLYNETNIKIAAMADACDNSFLTIRAQKRV